MKYRAVFRELIASDMSLTCPFLPEPGEYGSHFQAAAQDIQGLAGVLDATAQDDYAMVVTTSGLEINEFKAGLKPVLQHHFEFLRIASIEPWPPTGEA